MRSIGSAVDVTVASSGLTCGYIGNVESKTSSTGGDFCGTSQHYWHISYKISDERSGTMKSNWYRSWVSDDEISLESYPPGSKLCGSEHMCETIHVGWESGVGNAYVSYAPCGT